MLLSRLSKVGRPVGLNGVRTRAQVQYQVRNKSRALSMFDPWKEVDRDFEDLAFPTLTTWNPLATDIWDRAFDQTRGNIRFNVYETDNSFEIEASLPGLQKDDVKVNLKDDLLTVSAEKRFDKEKKHRNYKRVEHTYGYFSRSIRVPPNTDTSKLTAHLDNGVLKIGIPKTGGTSTQEVAITEGPREESGQKQGQITGQQEDQEQTQEHRGSGGYGGRSQEIPISS